MEVVKSLQTSFIRIAVFSTVVLSAMHASANCQSAKGASDAAQSAMQGLTQGTQGGSGVPSAGQGTAGTTCGLGQGLQGVGQPAQQAAQQCMQQCQQCPEDPDGKKGLKPTCQSNAAQCGGHLAKAMQALQQAAAANQQCQGSEETKQSGSPGSPMTPPKGEEKQPEEQQQAEQQCTAPMVKDPATGGCKQPAPKEDPDVITRLDELVSINRTNGGTTKTAMVGPTGFDDDRIVFASEGLDPVRNGQRRTALFKPEFEEEEEDLEGEGEELDEELETRSVGVPVLKDLYTPPKSKKSAVRNVAAIGPQKKAKKKMYAAMKSPEDLQKEGLLKAVLDPRYNVNPFVNIEKESEKIQKLIARKNFCEASNQIRNLGVSGDIHSQLAAADLQKKLDAKLDANRQPTGEFGISLLCNNQ